MLFQVLSVYKEALPPLFGCLIVIDSHNHHLISSLKVGLSVAWITGDIFLFHSISDKLLFPVDC